MGKLLKYGLPLLFLAALLSDSKEERAVDGTSENAQDGQVVAEGVEGSAAADVEGAAQAESAEVALKKNPEEEFMLAAKEVGRTASEFEKALSGLADNLAKIACE